MKDDDHHLWHTEVADVTPLKGRASPTPKPPSGAGDVDDFSDIPPAQKQATPLPPTPPSPTKEDTRTPHVIHNTADKISGTTQGLDPKTLKKLAAGHMPPADRLDLHGFYETQAWAAVQDFLHESFHNGLRCVLIIHGKGKGYGDNGDMGIIKANMASWLVHHPRVLAFHTATPQFGGRGAIFVYLKRQR